MVGVATRAERSRSARAERSVSTGAEWVGNTAAERSGSAGPVIRGVALDSRSVRAGDLYVALAGRAQHGASFVVEAVRAGASAVLTDAAGADLASAELTHALGDAAPPVIAVDDPRRTMAFIAARVYGQPAASMTMFAVTGTNGKTTTSFLLDAALGAAGRHTGVVGTIGYLLDGMPLEATRTTVTTPESPDLQALLAVLVEGGAESCVMEVSSHALALHRADAIVFDVAAFTNFGRDHLDFHGDVESYFEAKALLFTPERARRAVVNIDDERGRVLVARLAAAAVPTVTVSLLDRAADYWVSQAELGADGVTSVQLRTPDGPVSFGLGLPGDHNVRNAITALAMIDVVGSGPRSGAPGGAAAEPLDLVRAARGLAAARVPGRMERVDLGPDAPAVFVDFAHTPQAVTAALSAVAGRRCVVVLGAGGDRDPDKRALIGAAAAAAAEVVIVTDDNPRSEDPAVIRRQVLSGARAARDAQDTNAQLTDAQVIDGGERRAAIRRGLELAGPDDVLLVLGKGHEVGQEIAGTVLPFNDVAVLRDEWLALAGARAGAGSIS